MSIAARLKNYFDQHPVTYQVLSHPKTTQLSEALHQLNIPAHMAAQCALFRDRLRLYLLVFPVDREINLATLCQHMHPPIHRLPDSVMDHYFKDCEPGAHPPLGEPYHLRMMVDPALYQSSHIYLIAGSHHALIQLSQNDFRYLTSEAEVFSFTQTHSLQPALTHLADETVKADSLDTLIQQIHTIYPIPTLHEPALTLLKEKPCQPAALRQSLLHQPVLNKTYQDVMHQLERFVQDPWVSPWLAASFSIAGQFRMPSQGPLGRPALLTHIGLGLLGASIWGREQGLPQEAIRQACLVLIFQHLGFFWMADLFLPEYHCLSKMLWVNPRTSMSLLEKRLLGMGLAQRWIAIGHARIGAWLADHWQLPANLVADLATHHQEPHTLWYQINASLRMHGWGEGDVFTEPEQGRTLMACLQPYYEHLAPGLLKTFQQYDENLRHDS